MVITVGGLLSASSACCSASWIPATPFADVSLILEIAGALELGLMGAFVLAGAPRSQQHYSSQMTGTENFEARRERSVTVGRS
jgi:hypothetical protein